MTPDYVKHPGAMSEMACKYIKEKKPAFAAFIYDNPDYPGHMHGSILRSTMRTSRFMMHMWEKSLLQSRKQESMMTVS